MRTPNLPLSGPSYALHAPTLGLYMKMVGEKKEIVYKKIHQAHKSFSKKKLLTVDGIYARAREHLQLGGGESGKYDRYPFQFTLTLRNLVAYFLVRI